VNITPVQELAHWPQASSYSSMANGSALVFTWYSDTWSVGWSDEGKSQLNVTLELVIWTTLGSSGTGKPETTEEYTARSLSPCAPGDTATVFTG